jgi:hypothetical protein
VGPRTRMEHVLSRVEVIIQGRKEFWVINKSTDISVSRNVSIPVRQLVVFHVIFCIASKVFLASFSNLPVNKIIPPRPLLIHAVHQRSLAKI